MVWVFLVHFAIQKMGSIDSRCIHYLQLFRLVSEGKGQHRQMRHQEGC